MGLLEHTLFIYRDGDSDSESVANHYLNVWNLESSQIQSISCSSTEILPDYTTFKSEVEDPIKSRVSEQLSLGRDVWVIVLGYNVPGGFIDGSDTISATSRIARMDHSFAKFTRSYLFDRQTMHSYGTNDAVLFNEDDKAYSYIVGRLDGPTPEFVISVIDNGKFFRDTPLTASGRLYLHLGYRLISESYKSDLQDFSDNLADLTGLDVIRTHEPNDAAPDWIFPQVEDDAVSWGALPEDASNDYFQLATISRFFFYNADDSSCTTLKGDGYWCYRALNNGYSSTAGAMSSTNYTSTDPNSAGFLQPSPFFDVLARGATIGEAYIYSCEFYDSPMTFIGDPLISINLLGSPDCTTAIMNEDSVANWDSLVGDISNSIAYDMAIIDELEAAREIVVESHDIQTELDLLKLTDDQVNNVTSSLTSFSKIADDCINLVNSGSIKRRDDIAFEAIDNVLGENNLLVPELFTSYMTIKNNISDSYILSEGMWIYEFLLTDDIADYAQYHFIIQIANDAAFTDIVFQQDSSLDQDGWYYQNRYGEYIALPFWGISSAYIGRKIRFVSSTGEELDRAKEYYVRIRQWDTISSSTKINHDSEMIVNT